MEERYRSLEDFLIQNPLTIDGVLNDGGGAVFPVKGVQLRAAILIADIGGFSRRTADLSPVETLIFVNNFLSWITAESIRHFPCIIDRYVGDSVTVVFSERFGSENPILDAVKAARQIAQFDPLSFCPHMGMAYGEVVVGYTGTPTRFGCSVFGRTVTLASRCSEIRPDQNHSCSLVLPADLIGEQLFQEAFGTPEWPSQAPSIPSPWRLLGERSVPLKNIGDIEVREVIKVSHWLPTQSAEDRTRENLRSLTERGEYRPSEA